MGVVQKIIASVLSAFAFGVTWAADLVVLDYEIFSNRLGEYWAIVQVKNTTPFNRMAQSNDFLGISADGVRVIPRKSATKKIGGGESDQLTVFFGYSKFPITQLEMK